MRRSKVFLGIGAVVLSAFGAIAASSAPTAFNYYYYPSPTVCAVVSEEFECTTSGTTCEGRTGGALRKKLYRHKLSAAECDYQLQKN